MGDAGNSWILGRERQRRGQRFSIVIFTALQPFGSSLCTLQVDLVTKERQTGGRAQPFSPVPKTAAHHIFGANSNYPKIYTVPVNTALFPIRHTNKQTQSH
ncbi:hypothetical protein FKM82_030985 [Ascaphus truei]